jgi:acyl-CoA thioesterase
MSFSSKITDSPSGNPAVPDGFLCSAAVSTRFDRDTEARSLGDGAYEVRIDPGWWVVRGPNGGYIAALLVRALEQAVGDPARVLRSFTVHFLRPPAAGPAGIDVRIERAGRSVTTASARLLQDGRLQALAVAAFAVPRAAPELHHALAPEVAPSEACPPRGGSPIPIHERYEQRFAIGPLPFTGPRTREARTGGWLRLAEPRVLDAALLVAYADAWPPSLFACSELAGPAGGIPTLDLTVHVRTPLPVPGLRPDDPVLVSFHTREVSQGVLEEDGEVWSRDGRLLAHSRQLAILLEG